MFRVDALNTTYGVSVNNLTAGKSGSDLIAALFEPVTAYNVAKYIGVVKQETGTTTAIPGTVFGIYTDAACTIPAHYYTDIANKVFDTANATMTANESGVAVSDPLEQSFSSYYIKELSVPTGYGLSTDVTEITPTNQYDSHLNGSIV